MPPFRTTERLTVPPIGQQRMSNWCWAACTVYICKLYNTHIGLTQGQIVAQVLGNNSCNSNFPHPSCDQIFDLGRSFQFVNHFRQVVDGPLTPDQLINLFNNDGRPIGCQVRFPTFGHAVVIPDIRVDVNGHLFVVVADPGRGSINTVPYSVFRNDYQGHGGRWVRTYLTQ
jgi:hypothetical protein